MTAVLLERPADRVAVVRLDRPYVRNTINDTMQALIVEHLSALYQDRETACVVLTGSEKFFAAGADLRVMSTMGPAAHGGQVQGNV